MSDQDVMTLARLALGGDAQALVRCIAAVARGTGQAPITVEQAEQQGMRLRGVIAVDNEPLYDRIRLPRVVAPGEYSFFVLPLSGWREFGKTRVDTHMVNAGRLQEPERFEITGVSLVVRDDAPPDFVTWLRHEPYFEIRVGGSGMVVHREPTWSLVRRVGTRDVMEDERVRRPPMLVFPRDATIRIELNENFQACIIVASEWTGGHEAEAQSVRCIFHGWHAKGVRQG